METRFPSARKRWYFLAVGREAEEWNEVVGRLRQLHHEARWESRDVGRLYEIAQAAAPGLLRSFELTTQLPQDLASELLSRELAKLVECEGDAFAYFVVALRHEAIDWLRRGASRVAADPPERASPAEEDQRRARDELEDVWTALSSKEREVFAALAQGESREALAARFKTSRANIDQIVSRARAELTRRGLMPSRRRT
jgi:RNA polymerase sigma factor (sigma-70 family)